MRKLSCAIGLLVSLSVGTAKADDFTPIGVASLPDGTILEQGILTLDPGSGDPWHYHPGNLWVQVLSGEITEQKGCGIPAHVYHAGQAFHEEPGIIHEITNTGTGQAVLAFVGILPGCFTDFNDQISVSGPVCDGRHGPRRVHAPYACP
jgi:quercetin dioxygenase-like cupin family protein